MSTKNDPGQFDCYAKLAEDEPYFVLRAKDADGPDLVEAWVAVRLRKAFDRGQAIDAAYAQKLTEALQCAEAMRRWRLRQEGLKHAAAHYRTQEA